MGRIQCNSSSFAFDYLPYSRLLLWIPKDFTEVEVTLISTGIIAYPLKHTLLYQGIYIPATFCLL